MGCRGVSVVLVVVACSVTSCGFLGGEGTDRQLKEELTEREYQRIREARAFLEGVKPLHDIAIKESARKVQIAISELGRPIVVRVPTGAFSEVDAVRMTNDRADLDRVLAPKVEYFWNEPMEQLLLVLRPVGIYMLDGSTTYDVVILGGGKRLQRELVLYWQPMDQGEEGRLLTYDYSEESPEKRFDNLDEQARKRLLYELEHAEPVRFDPGYREIVGRVAAEIE